MQPRSIRLNNPGNIEHGAKWQGMAEDQPDSRFIKFISPEYGIRAIVRILLTYRIKYDVRSITEIVTRWAPPHENPTDAYIRNVSEWSGIPADKEVDLKDANELVHLVAGIIRQEAGFNPYTNSTILAGVRLGMK